MTTRKTNSSIDAAAAHLRGIALETPDGELLGSEDDIVAALGVSRATVRQAARLLERDGVVRVRRGINGGYFASRPSVEMVEAVVCTYLETLGLDARHTGPVSTALWVEVLREAARADRSAAQVLANAMAEKIRRLPDEPTMVEISQLEQETRTSIFQLIDGQYMELVFRINAAFARQQLSKSTAMADPEVHRRFVAKWKKAKLMELDAIAEGDETLAMMAGMYNRRLWIERGGKPLNADTSSTHIQPS